MKLSTLLLSGCLLVSSYAASASPKILDGVVAVVNDNVITASQLAGQMSLEQQTRQANHEPVPAIPILRQRLLDRLIMTELQVQLAKKAGFSVSEPELYKAMTNIIATYGGNLARLQTQLDQYGISYTQYREYIRQMMLIGQLQQQMVHPTVNEQEINTFLANAPKHRSTAIYHIEDLLIPTDHTATKPEVTATRKQVETLLEQARRGQNFQQLAATSPSPSSSLIINDLGWRRADELPNVFLSAIQKLAVGNITDPIRASNGWHLLRLIATRGDKPAYLNMTHARHILLKTSPLITDAQAKQCLLEIRTGILRGSSFAHLAEQYSQDISSAVKGGDLGWILLNTSDPLFEAQLTKLQPGSISLPFKTLSGWHIVQVLARRPIAVTNQKLVRNQAAIAMYQHKSAEALKNRLQQLHEQAYIKIIPVDENQTKNLQAKNIQEPSTNL